MSSSACAGNCSCFVRLSTSVYTHFVFLVDFTVCSCVVAFGAVLRLLHLRWEFSICVVEFAVALLRLQWCP